jgi:hypothetical protein
LLRTSSAVGASTGEGDGECDEAAAHPGENVRATVLAKSHRRGSLFTRSRDPCIVGAGFQHVPAFLAPPAVPGPKTAWEHIIETESMMSTDKSAVYLLQASGSGKVAAGI